MLELDLNVDIDKSGVAEFCAQIVAQAATEMSRRRIHSMRTLPPNAACRRYQP
jgi:hypothetical protein